MFACHWEKIDEMLCLAGDPGPDSQMGVERSPCQNLEQFLSDTLFSPSSPPFFSLCGWTYAQTCGSNQKIPGKHTSSEWHQTLCIILQINEFGVYEYRTWHIDTTSLSCGFRIAIGGLVIWAAVNTKKSIMEMRLGDYKYLTDYRAHEQWGNDTSWTILNVTPIWSGLDAVIWNRPWWWFGSGVLFYARFAYSTLRSVAYTHGCSDSAQPAPADIIM